MFNPRQSSKAPKQESKSKNEPKDALAALMDGETPNDESLRFPNEHSNSWRAKPTSNTQSSRPSSGMEDYSGDYRFESKPNQSMGEYRPGKPSGLDGVKTGAANTGTYIKGKSAAGVTYVKEKDWSREKELAGNVGTTAKNGAVYVGSGVMKGAGWLWSSGKKGVENLSNKDKK